MVGFIIETLTDDGIKALDQCLQEQKIVLASKNTFQRKVFAKIWIEQITRNPLKYVLTFNPDAKKFIDYKKLILEGADAVDVAMQKNGSTKGVDYFVDVVLE